MIYNDLLYCAVNRKSEFEELIKTNEFKNLSRFHRMSFIECYMQDTSLFSSIFSNEPDYDVYMQWYGPSYCKEFVRGLSTKKMNLK
jgi:hypothetical protein